MSRFFVFFGAISGFISVALGAFGAHALKGMLSESSLSTFHTAHEYQVAHSLVLLTLGILTRFDKRASEESRLLSFSGYSFLVGIILFSGSLYSLALTGISVLGAIAPLGGLAFLCGWAALATYAYNFSARNGQSIDNSQGTSEY